MSDLLVLGRIGRVFLPGWWLVSGRIGTKNQASVSSIFVGVCVWLAHRISQKKIAQCWCLLMGMGTATN